MKPSVADSFGSEAFDVRCSIRWISERTKIRVGRIIEKNHHDVRAFLGLEAEKSHQRDDEN
jgi:hypothetical protein